MKNTGYYVQQNIYQELKPGIWQCIKSYLRNF
jgi:hypothetical protein